MVVNFNAFDDTQCTIHASTILHTKHTQSASRAHTFSTRTHACLKKCRCQSNVSNHHWNHELCDFYRILRHTCTSKANCLSVQLNSGGLFLPVMLLRVLNTMVLIHNARFSSTFIAEYLEILTHITQHNSDPVEWCICKYWNSIFWYRYGNFSVKLEIGLKCGKITLSFYLFIYFIFFALFVSLYRYRGFYMLRAICMYCIHFSSFFIRMHICHVP